MKKKNYDSKLHGYLEEVLTISIKLECNFCWTVFERDTEFHDHRDSPNLIDHCITDLEKQGWKEVSSAKFGCIAVACKKCADMDDNLRGEVQGEYILKKNNPS